MDLSTSFDDVWVENLTTRVVLPEGAASIKATVSMLKPQQQQQQQQGLDFTMRALVNWCASGELQQVVPLPWPCL